MLPFLAKNKDVGVSAPTDKIERKPDEDKEESYDVMESCAEDLINAIHAKDVKGVAMALRAAQDLGSEPTGDDSNG